MLYLYFSARGFSIATFSMHSGDINTLHWEDQGLLELGIGCLNLLCFFAASMAACCHLTVVLNNLRSKDAYAMLRTNRNTVPIEPKMRDMELYSVQPVLSPCVTVQAPASSFLSSQAPIFSSP